jgi:hypothetical protein
MMQSQDPTTGSRLRRALAWPVGVFVALRRWIDHALLSNSIVVYRVEDPFSERVSGEEHTASSQRQRRCPSGELRL